jgi:hypothetical protein
VTDNYAPPNFPCRDPFNPALCYLCVSYGNQVYDAGALRSKACSSPWWDQTVWTCTGLY